MTLRGWFFFFLVFLTLAAWPSERVFAFPASKEEIFAMQGSIAELPAGERIAAWAESFVGTPYDPDPLGLYVTTGRIVADEGVDCMYHTFRSVELALSNTTSGASSLALTLRFRTKGVLGPDGQVINYEERYQYGMDMVRSGKWGEDVTAKLGKTSRIRGERGLEYLDILPSDRIKEAIEIFRSGDIVFFVKNPARRVVGEIVGHIGIIKREGALVYLIHASGRKNRGGEVVRLKFMDYAAVMPFIGIVVTRFK